MGSAGVRLLTSLASRQLTICRKKLMPSCIWNFSKVLPWCTDMSYWYEYGDQCVLSKNHLSSLMK